MEAPMFCGEFQAVIAKLRQEGYLFSRLDDLGHGPQGHAGNAHISSSSKGPKPNHHHLNHHPSRSLFCLREPGLFVDVLQVSSAHELRKEAQGLMASACTAREKLRAYSSSCRENAAPDSMEILKPLLDIVVSASMSATATGEALATIHRMIVDMNILKSFESGSKAEIHTALESVINSVVECVFRQTESGDDEIAIMWALEVLEGCVQHEAAQSISEKTLERVFVTIYKNSIASSNADMLRRLAVRKLGAMVTRLYGSLYNSPSSSSSSSPPSAAPSYDLSSRMFSFLCRRIDPQNGNWHEMEARQASLELVHAALVATINIESDHEEEHGCILADKNPSIHSDINDSLFRALLQICQVAGRLIEEPSGTSGFGDGSDVVKVVSMSSLEELDENPDQTQTQSQTQNQNQNQDQNQDQDQPKEDANSSNTDNDTDNDKGNNTNDDKSEAGSNANNNKSSRNNKTNKKRSNPKDPFVKLPTSFAALEAQYLKISNSYHKNLDQDKSRGEPGASMDSSSSSISTTQTSVTAVRMPLGILTRALRVVQLLIGHKNTRKFLKVQIQAFINSVFLRTLEAKPKSTDNEARRLVLETLTDLFADPSFSIDMYCNFDCSLNSSNVYENLFVYLSNHSFPKQLRKLALDTLQLMSLRCIHIGVKAISSRAGESLAKQPVSFSDNIYEPADLLKTKLAKRQLMTCAQEFNRKPKAGIAALVAAKIISDPPEPAQIAAFLRNTQGLDKEKIGEFLGATGDLSAAVLESFLKTFNMEKLPLLASLRMFLESFRLPKEAQQIDRVVQCFAEVAHLKCSDAKEFPTVDCTYLLTFSIILLNTDLHNPNIRPEKKMRFDQFKLNNTNYGQDVSQGKDMPAPLLRAIYDEIKVRQINTMSDGSSLTAEVTGDRWRDLMRIPSEMKLVVDGFHSSSSEVEKLALFRAYDKQMFAAIHKPAFAALSVVYHAGDPAKQPKAVEMALEGIMNCAEVSSRYGMVMVLDRIAVDVCKFTSLLTYAHISHSDDSDSDSGFYYGIEDDDDDEGNITDVDDEEDDDDDSTSSSSNNNNINNNNNDTSGSGGSAQDVGKQQNKAAVPPPQSPKGATSVSSNGRRSTNRENAPDVLGSRVKIQETLGLLQTSTKAQYAANAVLEIAHSHGSMLRLAWPHVVYCFLRLFDLDLLPLELLGESKNDNFIDPASRLKYHRAVAQMWLKDARSKVAQAMDALERSKGWVSWLSGESQKEAEALVRVQEEEMAKVEKAIKFAAASVSNLTSSDRDVQQSFTVRVIDRVKMDKVVSLVDDSKTFADNTLVAFVRGIVTSCCGDETICPTEEDILQDVTVEDFGEDVGESDARGDIRVDMLAPPSRASRLFGLHLLVEVALVNTERIHLVWQMVRSHLLKVLKSAKQPTCHTEKASVGLLRIALRLLVQGNSRSPVSDDLGGLFKYLLRIPNEIAPGFGALVSGALIRAFDSTDFKWNSAIAKTLIAISQLEEFGLVKNAAKILPKICSEPTMLDIPFGILIDVFKCYFCRACSHISNASRSSSEGSDGAQDLLIELLDLLYMIHSRILRGERDTWFESDLIVIECLIAITLGKVHDSIPPSVRSHSARLLLLIRDELPSLEKQKLEGLESFGQVLVAYPGSSTEVVSDASSSVPVEKKTTEQVESASDEKEEEEGGGEKVVEQEEKDASTNGNNDDDDDDDDEQSLR